MNITFLIGNGFDINLGLATRYSDYNAYYLARNESDGNKITDFDKNESEHISNPKAKNKIAESIFKEPDFWSDCELGLGKITSEYGSEKEYISDYNDYTDLLWGYLKMQQERFVIDDSKLLASGTASYLSNISSEFNAEELRQYNSYFGQINQVIDFQFITFNYTNPLDKIVESVVNTKTIIGDRTVNGKIVSNRIHAPFHIHGSLEKNSIIFGVNDVSQIDNQKFSKSYKFIECFVKEKSNIALGNRNIEKAKSILDDSTYICIFGLSLGMTDKYWWDYLLQWLLRSNVNRIVIYKQYDGPMHKAANGLLQIKFAACEKLLEYYTAIDKENVRQSLSKRIIVVVNSDIFKMKGFSIKKV
jgi:hypothetical protein